MLKTQHPKAHMKHPHNTWIIFIDGAARNNPGKAGAGIVIKKNGKKVRAKGFYLGIKTNNQAEYFALLLALYFIIHAAKPGDTIRISSDSQLLVKQLQGEYKVRNEGLKPLFIIAQSMAQSYPIEITHVMREENEEADALANEGIDKKIALPISFITMLEKHQIPL